MVTREEMRANSLRDGELETRQLYFGMLRARGVDDERTEAVAPFERPLRDIRMLDPRSRNVGDRPPVHAAQDLEPGFVDAVRRVAKGDRRPALQMPGERSDGDEPQRQEQQAERKNSACHPQ